MSLRFGPSAPAGRLPRVAPTGRTRHHGRLAPCDEASRQQPAQRPGTSCRPGPAALEEGRRGRLLGGQPQGLTFSTGPRRRRGQRGGPRVMADMASTATGRALRRLAPGAGRIPGPSR